MAHGLQSTSLARGGGTPFLRPAGRPAVAVGNWRALSAERRLALIEQSLARTGVTDGYPLAL